MTYVMLANLQVILFSICFVLKNFEKVFICCHTMSCIVVYCTTIIPNTLNKVANCIKLRLVKSWLT